MKPEEHYDPEPGEESVPLTLAEDGTRTSATHDYSPRSTSPLLGLGAELKRAWGTLPAWWRGERPPDAAMKDVCLLVSFVLLACFVFALPVVLKAVSPVAPPPPGIAPDLKDGAKLIVGENGAVAAENGDCSKLGVKVLTDGGNAVDAMVSTVLCQGVLGPFASGLGGGAFILMHLQDKNLTQFYDSRETAPKAATENMLDEKSGTSLARGLAVGVPGELKGIYTAHRQHGKLPWKDLVVPVIELARDGLVSPFLAKELVAHKSVIMESPSLRALFTKEVGEEAKKAAEAAESAAASLSLPTRRRDLSIHNASVSNKNGPVELLIEGDHLKQKKLAHTLGLIAEQGADAFYQHMAANLSADVKAVGGLITEDDISNYKVVKREPIVSDYHGFKIIGAPPPSSGGLCVAMALNILEGYQLRKRGRNGQSLHVLVETFKFIFGRRQELADPDFEQSVERTAKLMLSRKEARRMLRKVYPDRTFSPSYYVRTPRAVSEDSGTAHISVIDSDGNMVAVSSSINGAFGAQFVSQSTGVILNNQLAGFSTSLKTRSRLGLYPTRENRVAPLKRPLSSMAPTLVLRDGVPYLTLGAGGGPRIITATLQALVNVIDFGDDIATAISAPRLHHELIPNEVSMESINATTCALEHAFKRPMGESYWRYWSSTCAYLRDVASHGVTGPLLDGCVQGIVVPQALSAKKGRKVAKRLFAASDPRRIGLSAAY